jgi:hypothetical protein
MLAYGGVAVDLSEIICGDSLTLVIVRLCQKPFIDK